ncbi:hypothetical protein WJ28_22525 [Burkholderia thailandensis]|nr:hypothetical protein WJ27_18440 [Burkholderia thailandensis]KVG22364.1 hypothetical protein WJ28_22525 [Burkholderia thailandensis]
MNRVDAQLDQRDATFIDGVPRIARARQATAHHVAFADRVCERRACAGDREPQFGGAMERRRRQRKAALD